MKTLRRWARVFKRRLNRLIEVKSGILLAQPANGSSQPGSGHEGGGEVIRRTNRYRTDLPWSEQEFLRRTGNGNALYELFIQEQPVCYGWVAESGTRVGVLHDLRLVVPHCGFYIWDCATDSAFRGRGCFRTLLTGIIHGGYPDATLALVAVDTGNGASRQALAKAGFQREFSYLSARILNRSLFSLAWRNGKIVAAQREFDRLGDEFPQV